MAATLMTLIQASLLQQEHVDAVDQNRSKSSPENAHELLGKALRPVGPMVVQRRESAPVTLAGSIAGDLQKLIVAVAKLSDLDKMLEEAQQMKPTGDGEALKWHELSITTIGWSRKAQSEYVQGLLKYLQSDTQAAKVAATEAKPDVTGGRACAQAPSRPPGIFFRTHEGEDFLANDSEAKVESDGSVLEADVMENMENVSIGSLRNDLQKIRDRDASCCLIVRNIKRMGLDSPELLREHFGRLGLVEEVCVAHSFEKPNIKRTKHRNGRVRPAALGFVVMATEQDAQKVLAAGNEQMIGEVCVKVRLIEPFGDNISQPEGLF